MKKCFIAITIVLGLTTFFWASAKAKSHKLPPADGAQFWTYITETDPYTKWDLWPGQTGIRKGNSPHGAFVKILANSIAIEAAKQGKPLPYGSIIIKENYGKDQKTLMALTPMYRVKEYNPAAGDWFWAKYGPKGEIMAQGKPKGCVSCHKAVSDKSWVFTNIE